MVHLLPGKSKKVSRTPGPPPPALRAAQRMVPAGSSLFQTTPLPALCQLEGLSGNTPPPPLRPWLATFCHIFSNSCDSTMTYPEGLQVHSSNEIKASILLLSAPLCRMCGTPEPLDRSENQEALELLRKSVACTRISHVTDTSNCATAQSPRLLRGHQAQKRFLTQPRPLSCAGLTRAVCHGRQNAPPVET